MVCASLCPDVFQNE
ncbi:MAG: hypothetical protein G5Z43_000383 [Caldisphaeraceae archaeon]|nr:hypothetical protein [Caldisphaeraceae archaeon]MEB3691809.1 hypothetical protein [Caldisphaeraceae archaeon]